MAKRRIFTREFKVEAVRLVTDRGVSVAQAARHLAKLGFVYWNEGPNVDALGGWKKLR